MKTTAELTDVAAVSAELQSLQRERTVYMKSRIMVANRLQAIVAGTLGYHSGMPEKERTKAFTEAGKLIKQIASGKIASAIHSLVMTHMAGIDEFNRMIATLEKQMTKRAKTLPVHAWVERPEQRGFGTLFLAIVVGETGDLANYANPAKVWRRLGCAPHSFDGKTLMGATWKCGKEGKLPAAEWESFGYSPRRRSIAYLIGEGIVKQNFVSGGEGETPVEVEIAGAGPYRSRYIDAKRTVFTTHPEWKWQPCQKCKGTGLLDGRECRNCGGTGRTCLRAHRHGMLLATKLLLKNLWIEWNGQARLVV